MAADEWIWIRIHRRIAAAVAAFMRDTSEKLHEAARSTGNEDKRKRLTQEADDYHHVGKQIQRDYGIHAMVQPIEASGHSTVATGGNAAFHEGNSKLLPWLMLIALISGAGLMSSLAALRESDFTRRHVEEWRIRVEHLQNTMVQAGLVKPGDFIDGPEANPERLKKEK